MPSELPTLPRETHARLLSRGANHHLPILSHEVAMFPKGKVRIIHYIVGGILNRIG
jgi:hypothetical protein